MGLNQSVQIDEEEEEEDDDEDDDDERGGRRGRESELEKKLLEQEPEMLPCYASASPLSPQLSSLGTPRLGPSIKVWDPYNVLGPPPSPLTPQFYSAGGDGSVLGDEEHHHQQQRMIMMTEVYLINHGEWEMSLRPELIAGRCGAAALTGIGKRQARALAVFLNSQGVRFNAVYTSPLDRARQTAVSVCQEMGFPEEQIQSADALIEVSQGEWEGLLRSDIFTQELSGLINRLQPDFAAPSGESPRQVESRMIQFLNGTLLRLPEKLKAELYLPHHTEVQGFSQHNSIPDGEGTSFPPSSQRDLLHRHRQLSRKKSGKSRLQVVTTNEDPCPDYGIQTPHSEPSRQGTPFEVNARNLSSFSLSSIGVFTHSVPIKCLLTGILGCSPIMSHKFCIEDSSVTVLRYSWTTGWQIKRLNDTAHLRLL